MLSRGVDVGFPSEIVISLVFFIRFLFLNVYFHLFRVFLHSFFEILRITALLTLNFSCCTKISPDHVTVTSHSKWRLTVNFLKNSHSFSEYSIFTYSFALLLCLLLCTLFSEQFFFSKCFCVFSQLPTTLGSLWILPLILVLQFPLVRASPPCMHFLASGG